MEIKEATVAGALLGCAVGDAMGAPFEGLWRESIPDAESLLKGYHEYHGYPRGQYTDDTQLTVATVESIVETQQVDFGDIAKRIAALWKHHDVIGPGGACTHAAEYFLDTGDWTSMGAPKGQAGNGTAMRTAILGLQFLADQRALESSVSVISQLTHFDSRSVAGGVAIAAVGRQLAINPNATPELLCTTSANSAELFNTELAQYIRRLPDLPNDDTALNWIASAGQPSPEFAKPIITPFVIPTVLAAIYCINRCPDSWSQAVTFAIRLGGDVDTLGAIVGALAGIRHGSNGIPELLVVGVKNSNYLLSLAVRYHATLQSQLQLTK